MDKSLQHSPFLAVGIYISGDSRHAATSRTSPRGGSRLSSTRLATAPDHARPAGLPAGRGTRVTATSCRIEPAAREVGPLPEPPRKMGATEARKAVQTAKALGVVPGSTLWYDLGGFDWSSADCTGVRARVPQRVDPPSSTT